MTCPPLHPPPPCVGYTPNHHRGLSSINFSPTRCNISPPGQTWGPLLMIHGWAGPCLFPSAHPEPLSGRLMAAGFRPPALLPSPRPAVATAPEALTGRFRSESTRPMPYATFSGSIHTNDKVAALQALSLQCLSDHIDRLILVSCDQDRVPGRIREVAARYHADPRQIPSDQRAGNVAA